MTPFRAVAPAVAVQIALAEIGRLGLELRTETAGAIRTSRLYRGGLEVAVGVGKGAGSHGLAGAHFEALERFLMSSPDNRRLDPGATRMLSATAVARQPGLMGDRVVQRWALEFPDAVAACAAHGDIRYPIFLTDPRYFRRPLAGDSVQPYRSLLRYSSSLGTAAGTDRTEAVFHGLCELIEHDAVSQALLRWYIAGRPEAETVDPVELGSVYRETVEAVGAAVHVFDVTTDLGVPAYVATTDAGGCAGASASPSARYAAERALGELIQTTTLGTAPVRRAAGRLAAWPALRRCAELPIGQLRIRRVPLRTGLPGDDSPQRGLDQVGRRLGEHGIGYHACEVAPRESLISVACTIAPGLDRFSLVRLGVPVTPTGRGWHLWPQARDKARA